MSWANLKGFNFRRNSGTVSDGTNEIHVPSDYGSYPVSETIDGDTFNCGWEDGPHFNNVLDRDATPTDRRLCGIYYTNSSSANSPTWRVELPNTGTFGVVLAFGDSGNSNTMDGQLRDTSTALLDIDNVATSQNEFVDASGTTRTSQSDWASNGTTPTDYSFSTTIFRTVATVPSSSASCVAHVAVKESASEATPLFTLLGVG